MNIPIEYVMPLAVFCAYFQFVVIAAIYWIAHKFEERNK